MDPITHAAFGVACALALAGRGVPRRQVALAGLAGGWLPDADVLLKSATDPLFQIEYHRHFTHSVAFSPVLAVLGAGVAWLLARWFRQRAGWRVLVWPAWVAVLSHLFCDWWTSYGTRLGWPFSDTRAALHWVSVVDPLLTLPLLGSVLWAVGTRRVRPVGWGLVWVGCYLGLAVVQQQRAQAVLDEWVEKRGGDPAAWRATVKPSFANIVVWRALVVENDTLQVMAIRCGLGRPKVWVGQRAPLFASPEAAARQLGVAAGSRQARDIERFFHFSDRWVGLFPGQARTLGDLRYAALPNEVAPMWGIRLPEGNSEAAVEWISAAGLNDRPWGRLWRMIRGEAS